MKPNWWLYIVCPVVLLGLGFGSSFVTNSGNDNEWYMSLRRAPWTPPGWVFSTVWSVLYVLLGVAMARTIVEKEWHSKMDQTHLGILSSILLLILVWPFAYFMGKSQLAGIILILSIVVMATVYSILTGLDKRFVQLGCALPLVVWGTYATSLALYPVLHA
jgi:benzodiazapine receptor